MTNLDPLNIGIEFVKWICDDGFYGKSPSAEMWDLKSDKILQKFVEILKNNVSLI